MALIAITNTASTFTACGTVPSTCGHFCRVWFTATPGGSGSAAFYTGSALTDGSPLFLIVAASGTQTYMSPLFNPTLSIIVASVSGGSAILWMKAAS